MKSIDIRLEPKALSMIIKKQVEIYLPIPGESQVIVQGFEPARNIQAKIVFQIIFLQSDLVSFAKTMMCCVIGRDLRNSKQIQ